MAKPNKYAAAARRAQELTDEEYKSVISGLDRLTDKDIGKLFPEQANRDKLTELLALVKAGTSANQKVTKLKENAERFSVVIMKLVKFFL